MATWSSYEYEPVGISSHGDKVLVEIRQRMEGAASGLPVANHLFQVWTVRDGLATSMEMYTDRARALEAAGVQA
jgi:ketosteroid isomerase-like protein